jgi:hypothetical protein
MKHLILSFAAIGLASMSVTPLAAGNVKKAAAAPQKEVLWDWWFIHSSGETPKREVILIDSLSISKEVDHAAVLSGKVDPRKAPPYFMEADGVTVFEDAKNKPARHNGRVVVNCATEQMMFKESYKQHWQAERFEKVPATRWFAAGSDIKFAKIAQFLCDPKAFDNKKGRNDKLLMMRVDQTSDPLDTVWRAMWSDVPQPKFTTKKTKEQAMADFEKSAAKAQATIDKGTRQAMETRTRILRDEKVTAMEQKALFSKMRSKASPVLHSWLGAEERSLVASWGIPSSSYGATGARFITYTEGYATQMEDQYGNVQPGSRNEFYCDMTFEIRDGIIKDYRSGGNYCGTASTGKPRGPN